MPSTNSNPSSNRAVDSLHIMPAVRSQAPHIACLIMMAMSDDCCRHFCGPRHTLDDFYRMMTHLVEAEHSQYSYRNTLVAMLDGKLAGSLTCYDGALLHQLREAFVDCAKRYLDRDFTGMDDETGPGELYLDSMAVKPECRHHGVATALLSAGIERARSLGIPLAGLLVDKDNRDAERLYGQLGFTWVDDTTWAGHPMRHLVIST